LSALRHLVEQEIAQKEFDKQALLDLYAWWPKSRADLEAAKLPPIHEMSAEALLVLARELAKWKADAST
jgi:hypothetical protein